LEEVFPVVVVIVVMEPLQICVSGIVRVIRGTLVLKIHIMCFYLIGIGFGAILAFYFKYHLMGIWMGWVGGLVISILFFTKILWSANWEMLPEATEEE
jgi:Na+-driven multidrug efflux pump